MSSLSYLAEKKLQKNLPFGSCCYPDGSAGKESASNEGDKGDTGSIPGSGRSPGGGRDYPLQYSCWKVPWTEEPGGLQSTGHSGWDMTKCTAYLLAEVYVYMYMNSYIYIHTYMHS